MKVGWKLREMFWPYMIDSWKNDHSFGKWRDSNSAGGLIFL